MKKLILSFLVMFSNIYVVASSPTQPQLDEQKLSIIIDKMKNNDALSPDDQTAFDSAIRFVKAKIQQAGGKRTTLTSIEAKIFDQDSLNQVKPSIPDILESGKKFKWGLDLALVEERGIVVRKKSVGGEDLASYVATFQKVKSNPNDPRYQAALDKIIKITKLSTEQIQSIPGIQNKPSARLEKLKQDMTQSVTLCKCLAGVIEPNAKVFPQKKSVFTMARYSQSDVYDRVNAMKINANVAMTQLNKDIDNYVNVSQSTPAQETALQQRLQGVVDKIAADCSKNFADLGKEITKLSSNKTIIDGTSCRRN